MKSQTKIIIGVLAVAVVLAVALGGPKLFKGSFPPPTPTTPTTGSTTKATCLAAGGEWHPDKRLCTFPTPLSPSYADRKKDCNMTGGMWDASSGGSCSYGAPSIQQPPPSTPPSSAPISGGTQQPTCNDPLSQRACLEVEIWGSRNTLILPVPDYAFDAGTTTNQGHLATFSGIYGIGTILIDPTATPDAPLGPSSLPNLVFEGITGRGVSTYFVKLGTLGQNFTSSDPAISNASNDILSVEPASVYGVLFKSPSYEVRAIIKVLNPSW